MARKQLSHTCYCHREPSLSKKSEHGYSSIFFVTQAGRPASQPHMRVLVMNHHITTPRLSSRGGCGVGLTRGGKSDNW